ncbi:hypothetical protein EFV37_23315 [Mesorhizobium loti]|uniref:Uncharacterized protein n=1 Tax=Mesorhizobium jarvisii TaxID=1777867 RepID=A0A6M7TJ70_9HYPH|nr:MULTISPECIES: hypothetical protein [Mesorhizobium]ANN59357.1 hypothetical protein A9174_23265 [Mesorhizobium loti NZP2037]OBQ69808.1 hypothetical protein A9K72_34130 [Mesorhizobium loti]QKC64879.1 hypothetical protein EB229_23310 [Mesorhizobium jarvisii]QKD10793.1 hypothetical protein EFV37_23315 [Mesorhizobium loti]RJT28268.1 hypothetical protein D3242_32885 [Mesorhizobium jarvisii]
MRKFFTSLFAFFISWFAGGLVALGLAIATDAQEEYILVFMASALVTIVVAIVFFVAQFFSNAPAIIDWLALCTIVLFVLVGLGLIGWTFSQPVDKRQWGSDLPIVAGLVLPNLATVLVHWLFVRWRVGRGLMNAQVNA